MVRPLCLLAILVAATRLFFLPPTLDDIDSVNFALALDEFDPTQHRPQPPGYPVHVAAARVLRWISADSVQALALVSGLSQVALVPVLYGLFSTLGSTPLVAFLATVLTMAAPVLWMSGVRPMSDSFGLLLTMLALKLLLFAPGSPRRFVLGSFLAGLAPGARLQSVFLTSPAFVRGWLLSPGARARSFLALCVGSLLWLVPVAVASRGITPYAQSLLQTMAEAAAWEPLVRDFNLNRAVRSLVDAFWSPWGHLGLASIVLGLGLLGFIRALRQGPSRLGLALLVFCPYAVVHLLLQNVPTVRYSLLYLPFLCWLAIEGLAAVGRHREPVLVAATAALVSGSAWVALPALLFYHASPSPIYAALDEAGRIAEPRDRFLLSGHYLFSRYYRDRPRDLELLAPEPRKELAQLQEYWRSGGLRKVLFLSDPARTDLSTFSSEARESRGYWRWPEGLDHLLSGERPSRVELVEVSPPLWFTGPGWLISLESTRRSELASFPEKVAFLKPLAEETFLLIAGEPLEANRSERLAVELDGIPLEESDTLRPLLSGFRLPPAETASWRELVVKTGATSFALRGLEYGAEGNAGIVYGEGWYYPERDEVLRPFRWAGPSARALVHVPEKGTTLTLEGEAPVEYIDAGLSITLVIDGDVRLVQRIPTKAFRLETHLGRGSSSFQEVRLLASRSFVPDRWQRNGDRRELSLRVYSVRFSTEEPLTVARSSVGYPWRAIGPAP